MLRAFLLVLFVGSAAAFSTRSSVEANPIRKIVTLMQDMQKEIEAEGEKEKGLFDKFMCYCETTIATLSDGVANAKSNIENYSSKLEEDTASKTSTNQELADHKNDRESATQDLAKATAIRSKENEDYVDRTSDAQTNIAALAGAIPSLEKGLGSSALLQLPGYDRLRKVIDSDANAFDRQSVFAFLDQKGDYVPQSGQIVGIMKQMQDEMEKTQSESEADEKSAAAGYEELKAAKLQEISVASEAIETKTKIAGELAVSVVQNQDALDDATAELADTEKYLAELRAQCAGQQTAWAARQNARAEEVAAISEAISILNDDDALDIFKKSIPSALLSMGAMKIGFLQAKNTPASQLHKALAYVQNAAETYKNKVLNLISFKMSSMLSSKSQSKTKNFGMIMKMLDTMVVHMEKEQAGDEKHKSYCDAELVKSANEGVAAQKDIDATSATMSELADQVSTLADEISALEGNIKALDLSVAQATLQRKEENSEHTEMVALNEAAAQLIDKAKQRLYKFYNPLLYKEPPKKELTMKESLYAKAGRSEWNGFAQVNVHRAKSSVAPPAPPASFDAGYSKKSDKSTGVLALMDMIVKDLKSDMEGAQREEADSQTEYERLMADSATSRAQNAKTITDKEASKAQLEAKNEEAKEAKVLSVEQLMQIHTMINNLHSSCDFMLDNFDMRKEARVNEIESLKNAKSVLAGADFA